MTRSILIAMVAILACVFISACTSTPIISPDNSDKTNHNIFIDDPKAIGNWISVDFISNIDDFKPEVKSFKGDLYLKYFTFEPNGKTHKPFWTWTNGKVYHSGDKTTAKYLIKAIDGKDYLFLEWMNGDAVLRGMNPSFYVLRRKIDGE